MASDTVTEEQERATEHLYEALTVDVAAEKDYHVWEALQLLYFDER